MTWDDHAKEGGQPAVPYKCQGNQTQVRWYPICQAYNCQWSQTQTPYHARPNLTAKGLGQGICNKDEGTTKLVARVPVFVPGLCKRAPHDLCTSSCQETGCGFLAACSPSQKIRMVGSSPSLSTLHCNDFLLPGDLKGSQNIHEMRKEKTLALAKGPQSCSEWSGGPYSMMCGTVRDLQGCMTNLMQFEEENIWEIPLLKPADDLSIASPTLEEEAALLGEPWEAWATTTCPLRHEEWAPKPESAARLG